MKLLKGILTFLFLWINTIIIKADTSPIKGYAPIQKIIIIHPSTTTKIIFTTTPLQTNPIKNFATLRKKGVCGQKKCIDLYSFGFGLPSRKYSSSGDYRYTFNGKETDNETGLQDYGMRQYDPRTIRFPGVDPLTASFPMLTPYQFASNSPLANVDLDGLEAKCVVNDQGKLTQPAIEILKDIVPGGKELLSKIKFVVNDSYVPSGMGAITIGLTVYLTKSNSKFLEGNTGLTLEMVGHEGTHGNDVDNIGVFFYLEYARESAEAFINAGFSTTNPKTGQHIHDDLPLEQTANETEKSVKDYVKENPKQINILDSKHDDKTKTQLIINDKQSKGVTDSDIPKSPKNKEPEAKKG
jgi:RHS repeat-associated protein